MKICTGVDLGDTIMDVKFKLKNFRDFMSFGVKVSHWLCTHSCPLPQCSAIMLPVIGLSTLQHLQMNDWYAISRFPFTPLHRYSYYILPGFCHLLCNPVDIFFSCCTFQLINKLLPCLFLCKSNTFLAFRLASLYLFRSLAVLVLCHIL